MALILENQTGSVVYIDALGQDIEAGVGVQQDISYVTHGELVVSGAAYEIITKINADTILIHDGSTTLSKADSLEIINNIISNITNTTSHPALDQLVHNIAENTYMEVIRSSGLVSSIIIWEDVSKTIKIREYVISRTGSLINQMETKQYDKDGNLGESIVNDVTYTGNMVESIAGVFTP